jgi:hypothetical protein
MGIILFFFASGLLVGFINNSNFFKPTIKTDKDLYQLEKEYSSLDKLTLVILLVFVLLFGCVIWYGLYWLSSLYLSRSTDSVFVYPPIPVIWAFPAFLLPIFLATVLFHYFYLVFLGEQRYSEYTDYGNMKYGYDTWKVARYASIVFVPACMVFSAMSFDCYIKVTDNKFIVNDLLSYEERIYPFEKIRSIKLVKSHKGRY